MITIDIFWLSWNFVCTCKIEIQEVYFLQIFWFIASTVAAGQIGRSVGKTNLHNFKSYILKPKHVKNDVRLHFQYLMQFLSRLATYARLLRMYSTNDRKYWELANLTCLLAGTWRLAAIMRRRVCAGIFGRSLITFRSVPTLHSSIATCFSSLVQSLRPILKGCNFVVCCSDAKWQNCFV